MQFHMQEMMSKGLKATINEQLDMSYLFKGRQDVYRTEPLRVSLTVVGHEDFIAVDGELSIDMELACSRCLDSTKAHIVIPLSEKFKQVDSVEETDEDEDKDDDFIEVAGERLNLLPVVEESLLLFMPFAPLCDNECRGLCPNCGQNLNERKCSCSTEKIDPRFAALKDLFKE